MTVREFGVCPFTPLEAGLPHVAALVSVKAEVFDKKTRRTTRELRQYIASEFPIDRTPREWLDLVRGHWAGVESRNHYKRDVLLHEDKIRSRHPTIRGALALLHNTVHFLMSTAAPGVAFSAILQRLARHPETALALVRAPKPRLRLPDPDSG